MSRVPTRPVALLAAIGLSACLATKVAPYGDLRILTSGDTAVEAGFAGSDLVDGWAITFSRFLVNVGGVAIGEEAASVITLGDGAFALVDQVHSGQKIVAVANDVAARAWPAFSFSVRPARASSLVGDGALTADLARMRALGASLLVQGSASKDGVTKSFEWPFTQTVVYENCQVTAGGRTVRGLTIGEGAATDVELTIRAQPFFEDNLGTLRPNLRFEPFAAADRDNDGIVTLTELAAVNLRDVRTRFGNYATGGASEIVTLADYLRAQAVRVGAFRGVGTCQARRVP